MEMSIAEHGRKYYDEHLKEILELKHFGEFVVIDPDSGKYFLGKTDVEAMKKGKAAIPDKILFLTRIGCKVAYKLGGSSLRLFSRNKVKVLKKDKSQLQK